MFRNAYDNDVTVWSPQGRLHQIEYAMEAVKQGSACVGIKSETHAVVAAILRSPSELASYQQKIFKVDDHMGMAIAGLTADARYLTRFMRAEALNHRYVFGGPLQAQRLVNDIADKSQRHTQEYGKRPYGVGLLVAAYDQTGAHLFETDPSGNFYDYHAQAIGARSQGARTYLESRFEADAFPKATLDELIKHALFALKETIGRKDEDERLTAESTVVGVVGVDTVFKLITGDDIEPYLEDDEAAPMDVDEN